MRVAVIGAGTMGAGIAQVCATAGPQVAVYEPAKEQAAAAKTNMRSSLERFIHKEKLTSEQADQALERVEYATSIADAVDGGDVVIEAVVERLDVKQEVLAEAMAHAPEHALLGTNTSQFSITTIGAAIGDAATRLIGMHFFNPPMLMRLVELVCGLRTSESTVETAREFAVGLGKETVVCRKDSPGFLTSRVSAAVRLECLRILEEGVAEAADIDKALRLGFNWPMGPLELGDFNGLDTYLHALESLAEAYGERFLPPVTLRNLVAAGRLGRKSGWGFYRYTDDGTKIEETGA